MKMFRAALIAAAAACASNAWGGDNTWTPTGPSGAPLEAIRYLPGPDRVAIAVTTKAIYRSTDDGGSWTQVQRLPTTYDSKSAGMLAVNPANGNQVLVASGSLYRSTDGGLTWTVVVIPTGTGANLTPTCVAFAASGNVAWVGGQQGMVYRSPDGGATWEQRKNGIPSGLSDEIVQIEVDAADASVAYVRAGASANLFRTQDGGLNWSWLLFPYPIGTEEFAASRVNAGVLIRTSEFDFEQAMDRTMDHADNWSRIEDEILSTVRFSPSTAGRALAFDALENTLKFTENDGASWTQRSLLPIYWPTDFSFDPASDDRIFMAGASGALLSEDRGLTWSQRNSGLREAWITSIQVRGDIAYAVANDLTGLYRLGSTGTWEPIGDAALEAAGRPDGFGGNFAMTSMGDNSPLIFVRGDRVARSMDNGVTWTQIATLPVPASSLVWDPTNALTGYVIANSRIYKTVDGGFNWGLLENAPGRMVDVAVDPSNPAHLVSAHYQGTGAGVWRSEDGGLNWATAALDAEAASSTVFKPGSSAVIYVAAGADGIFTSSNGGATWAPLTGLPEDFVASRILIDPNATDVMYALDARESWPPAPRVLRSVDGGASWESLDFEDAFGNVNAWTFALLPQGRGDLVVSSRYSGLNHLRIAPDLRLTSSGSMTAATAGNVVLTVTNQGEFTASAVQLTAQLPVATGAYSVQATGATCTVTGRQLECTAVQLRPQATLSANIGFTASAAGTWQATVEAREFDPLGANNSVTLNVATAPSNPPSQGSGGKGGGGRLDYLLLAMLLTLSAVRCAGLRRARPA